jgi:hypothetical protein
LLLLSDLLVMLRQPGDFGGHADSAMSHADLCVPLGGVQVVLRHPDACQQLCDGLLIPAVGIAVAREADNS